MRLFLTLASLAVIYKNVMETGDPTNLFSNLLVLYAMYYVSYQDKVKESEIQFVKVIRYVVIGIGFICFIGWIEIITLKEVNGQYFILFSEEMRLGEKPLINVHIFICILSIKLAVFSGIEWFIGLWDESTGNNDSELEERKEGA